MKRFLPIHFLSSIALGVLGVRAALAEVRPNILFTDNAVLQQAADVPVWGDSIVVTSPKITKPVAVRYGWANVPDVNLFNKEGLPASPFRTEVKL